MKIENHQIKSSFNKVTILGVAIDNLSMDEVIDFITTAIKKKLKGSVITCNVSTLVTAKKEPAFKAAYDDALLVLADGKPLILASRVFGNRLKGRCAGSDLFVKICGIAHKMNKEIFLLGGINDTEKKATQKLRALFPGLIVECYSPLFGYESNIEETTKIIKKINAMNSPVLLVFTGAPKSEKWIQENMNDMNISLSFPLGAALDFFVGSKKRAPLWIQTLYLEWFWRLIHEPRRLWKRYLVTNSIFIVMMLQVMLKKIFSNGSSNN
jgi:N-acetylglucosaminyldiphosphoundecaprenol N-acetyl-beta-D-mannosaminyltransferase